MSSKVLQWLDLDQTLDLSRHSHALFYKFILFRIAKNIRYSILL